MSSVYDRLGFNFDTTRFNGADTLSQGASNTLNLIASTTGQTSDWQKTDLASGPVVRTNYFVNPTQGNVSSMLVSTINIQSTAISTNTFTVLNSANNLIVELNAFLSHTNNVSGVSVVTDPTVPSLSSAQNIGQLNMMTLSKTDGVSNTVPILGSYTSLFIPDILQANTIQLAAYASEFAGSITVDDGGNTISSLSDSELNNIENYMDGTRVILNTRRTEDWSFYRNSLQISKDAAFLQQFNGMGGTMSYLINNVVGTDSLKQKINPSP